MTPDLLISLQLSCAFQKILGGKQSIHSILQPDFPNDSLQPLFAGDRFIIDEQIHLKEIVVCSYVLSRDSKASVEEPMICFEIKRFKDSGRNNGSQIRLHRHLHGPVAVLRVEPSVKVQFDFSIIMGADLQALVIVADVSRPAGWP